MRFRLSEGFWHFRTVLFGCGAIITLIVVVFSLQGNGDSATVWVTQKDVELGQKITESDLRLVSVPPSLAPRQSVPFDSPPADVPAARFIPSGSILTELDLLGSEQSRSLNPDQVILKITLNSFTEQTLGPGDMIELWGSPQSCSAVSIQENPTSQACLPEALATEVQVLQVNEAESGWTADQGMTISVVLGESEISAVLQAEVDGTLTPIIRPVT